MIKLKYILPLVAPFVLVFLNFDSALDQNDQLRVLYSKPIAKWPKPTLDSAVVWQELAALPYDVSFLEEQQKPLPALGKLLFFDPRLSGSNQVSCSSCHDPQLGWADGRDIALGNDHRQGPRNTISITNVAQRKALFWDGRASSLEEQALGPLLAQHEMAADLKRLPRKIAAIRGYEVYFKNAFGDTKVTVTRMLEALRAFQNTIKGRRSRFDEFVDGDYAKLSDQEIQGLHLFRTKARCMNCHNGPYFTDHDFHNIGLTYYKRELQDLGRYAITKDPKDVGRFQTPMLRDVMHTFPWMHTGLFDDIKGLLSMYNSGMQMVNPTEEEKQQDPLFPVTDPLMKPLGLSVTEIDALAAFLESITATAYKMDRPQLPR